MSKNIKVKPGKTQSSIGVIAGGIFVLIGIFVVIPTFGVFGIIWTLFAALIMGSHLINATSDKGIATHEIVIEDSGEQNEESKQSVEDRLRDLQRLYDTGLITSSEYEEKRKKILEEL